MKKADILILIGVSIVILASCNAITTPGTIRTSLNTRYNDIPRTSASNLGITSITYTNGTGTYVEGMKFGIRVAFSNTGDTAVHGINATISFASYPYLSANQTNAGNITVVAGGSGHIDFSITVNSGATNNASVVIKATWAGTETGNIPVNGGSGSNNMNVAIQSKANVVVLQITCGGASSAGPFVGGMTFVVRVLFQNNGGTAVLSVAANPYCIGYTGLSITSGNYSNSVTIPANGGQGHIDFNMTVASTATTNLSVILRSTWVGNEQYSSHSLAGGSLGNSFPPNLNVGIQQQSNVTITGINYRTGSGTYVGGMIFTVRVSFLNNGGTAANGITALLSYGGYTSLSANASQSISLGIGAIGHIDFNITVAASAPTQNPVTISATWSGTEAISSRVISGSSPVGANRQVAIQAQASVSITSITYRTGAGTYVGGMTFTIRIAFSNTGGTIATNINAVPTFGGYIGLSANTTTPISISAGGTGSLDFLITVAPGATTQNPVTISATWSGTEAISSRSLNGNSGSNNLNVAIQAQAYVVITGITYRTGSGTYVGGMTFVIRVSFSNTGGTAVNNVNIPGTSQSGLSFGVFTKFTYNSSNSITIAAGGTGYINLLITLGVDAPSQNPVTITEKWNGTEAISSRAMGGNSGGVNLQVVIQSQAAVLISSVDVRNGIYTYVGGMSFVIRVKFSNTGGGTAVNSLTASLTYGGYSSLSANASNSITIAAGGSGSIDFNITVATGAASHYPVTITATGSGTEAISNRALSITTGAPTLTVTIQSQANVAITGITYTTGTGTYVGGMNFVIRLAFSNTGGTTANGITATPNYSGFSYLSANASNTISLTAGNTGFIDFNITVSVSTLTQNPVTINATWTGTEAISSRPLSGNAGTHALAVSIRARSNLEITSITHVTGTGTYVGGMTFVIRVSLTNYGGVRVTGVTANLNFGGYSNLLPNASNTITVLLGNTGSIDFLITVATIPVANASVVIKSYWSGTEYYSNRPVSGTSGANNTNVAVQTQSNVAISNTISPKAGNGNGTYVGGMTFVLRISFSNSGGTAANGITASLAYGGYSSLSANTSNSITVSAGGTGFIDFLITVATSASSQHPVIISATWAGTEAISLRSLSGDSTGKNLNAVIYAQASLAITSITCLSGNGTYVAGQQFVVRVSLSNPATSAKAMSVSAPLAFGGATGISANGSVSRSINGSGQIDFQITLTTGAPSQPTVTITTTVTGSEEISGRSLGPLTSNLVIAIKAQAVLAITSIVALSGNGTYVAGQQFVVRVSLSNPAASAKALTVTAPLSFGGAAGISANSSASKTVSGTATIDFLITITAVAPTNLTVTIKTTVSGAEEISGRLLGPLTSTLGSAIKSQAALAISAPTCQTVNGTYVAGMTFVVRVPLTNNPATNARALSVTASLSGLVSGVTANSSVSKTILGTGNIDFLITIAAGVTTQTLSITASVLGTEEISGRGLNVGPSPVLSVTIKAQAVLAISGTPAYQTGNGTYVADMTFVLRVPLTNNPATNARAKFVNATLSGLVGGVTANSSVSKTILGAGYIDFLITIGTGVTSQSLSITASVIGTEEISGRALSAGPSSALSVTIKAQAALAISTPTYQTVNSTYVAVMGSVVRVPLTNHPVKNVRALGVKALLSGLAGGVTANSLS